MTKSFSYDKKFKIISPPHQTVSRIVEISQQLYRQLSEEPEKSTYFLIALNESIDITDIYQLLIVTRIVDVTRIVVQFSVRNELLDLVPYY